MKHLAFSLCLLLPTAGATDPLFPNSVVSNDIEFISSEDESAFYCLHYFGTDTREMPDKRKDGLLVDDVHIFEAWFLDGTAIQLWVHPDFRNTFAATLAAQKLTGPLGHLPWFMRERLDHVVVHKGDETAFAEDRGRFFVVYDGNMDKRISTHDLEETVFHESVHATMDVPIAHSAEWRKAQAADKGFVTTYGASFPEREDLAETALFAFAYFQHPERLPDQLRSDLETLAPNRLAFLEQFFGPSRPIQRNLDGLEDCTH